MNVIFHEDNKKYISKCINCDETIVNSKLIQISLIYQPFVKMVINLMI